MSFFVRVLYKIVSNFLEEVTRRKLTIVPDEEDKTIFNFIREDNLERRFGGAAEDLIYDTPHALFPPRMPTNEFLLDSENKSDILVSEEEYSKIIKKPGFPKESISPFYIEKMRAKEELEKKKQKEEKLRAKREMQNIMSSKNSKEIKDILRGTRWGVNNQDNVSLTQSTMGKSILSYKSKLSISSVLEIESFMLSKWRANNKVTKLK